MIVNEVDPASVGVSSTFGTIGQLRFLSGKSGFRRLPL